jgi:hypothetical protein
MQKIATLMKDLGLSASSDITGLIDASFAEGADTSNVTGFASILRGPVRHGK